MKNKERIAELDERVSSLEDRWSEVPEGLEELLNGIETRLDGLSRMLERLESNIHNTSSNANAAQKMVSKANRRLDTIEPLINKTETEKVAIHIAEALEPIFVRIRSACYEAKKWADEKAYNDMADALEQLNAARAELSKFYATKQSIR